MSVPPARRVVDRELALARVGGDETLLKEIAELFLADYPNALRDLRQAVARTDADALERAAHGLKGSVANFGAQPVVDAAQKLENMGRSRTLEDAGSALTALELALDALRPELQSL
jgi:two-component system sensor histidine kinase/response regulator